MGEAHRSRNCNGVVIQAEAPYTHHVEMKVFKAIGSSALATAALLSSQPAQAAYTECNQHGYRTEYNGAMISVGRSGDVIYNKNGRVYYGTWTPSRLRNEVLVKLPFGIFPVSVSCPWGGARFNS